MKRLALLALVFAALGAFVYFYEIAGKESRDQAQELEDSILRLERDRVTSISISFTGKAPVRLEKVDDKWMLREPLETLADSGTVDSLLRSLSGAKRDRVFDEEGLDLTAFGLEDPAGRVEIAAGDDTRTLLLGAKDFSGSKVYSKLGDDPAVLLTSVSLLTSLDKPVLDWRSKQALSFDRGKVEEIEIRRTGEVIRFVRRDGTWHILAPVEDLADDGTINTLLSTLEFARARDFVSEEPASLQEYGLDRPAVSVRMREAGSDQWHQLDLGQAKDEEFYARDHQRKPVFTLSKDVHTDLTRDVWAFRQKDIIDIRQDEIRTLRYRHGEDRFTVSQDNYKWTFEEPEEHKGKEALSYKFWYPLDDLQFSEILQPEVMPEPEIEVEIVKQDGTTHTYRLARTGNNCFAWKGDGARVGRISSEDFEKVLFKAADLLETPAAGLESAPNLP